MVPTIVFVEAFTTNDYLSRHTELLKATLYCREYHPRSIGRSLALRRLTRRILREGHFLRITLLSLDAAALRAAGANKNHNPEGIACARYPSVGPEPKASIMRTRTHSVPQHGAFAALHVLLCRAVRTQVLCLSNLIDTRTDEEYPDTLLS